MNSWPTNLKIDSWWKFLLCLGALFTGTSLIVKIEFVPSFWIFMLGIGLIIIGLSLYMAQAYAHIITPKGILVEEIIKHTRFSYWILIIGIAISTISLGGIIYHNFKMGIFDCFFEKDEVRPAETTTSAKNEVEDFFKIDLKNIMKYKPAFLRSEINIVGREVKYYTLRLKELELGLFYELEIVEVMEGEYNITFKGRSNTITKGLSDFLNFYTNKYGLDETGLGKIEQADYYCLDTHSFSRIWKNLMLDNNSLNSSNGNIEMTLMGIKNT